MGDWALRPSGLNSFIGNTTNSYLEDLNASATANTKGAWSERWASTPFDACGVLLNAGYVYEGNQCLADIGIGPSGSEVVLIPDLLFTSGSAFSNYHGINYFFPIAIPGGTRISARIQTSTGSRRITLGIRLFAGGFGSCSPLNVVTCFGADASDSGGLSIDPGGTANTLGSWSQMTASCPQDIQGLIFATGNQLNAARTWTDWMVDIGVGAAGSEQVIFQKIPLFSNHNTDYISPPTTPFMPTSIPAGSRIAVRAQCGINDATDRTFDACIYGVS